MTAVEVAVAVAAAVACLMMQPRVKIFQNSLSS